MPLALGRPQTSSIFDHITVAAGTCQVLLFERMSGKHERRVRSPQSGDDGDDDRQQDSKLARQHLVPHAVHAVSVGTVRFAGGSPELFVMAGSQNQACNFRQVPL